MSKSVRRAGKSRGRRLKASAAIKSKDLTLHPLPLNPQLKLSRRLRWLWPYLEAVTHLVDMTNLTHIRITWFTDKSTDYGFCLKKDDGRYSIAIRCDIEPDLPYFMPEHVQEHILRYLAHELAHLKYWDHSTDHMMLTGELFYEFCKMVKKIGWQREIDK